MREKDRFLHLSSPSGQTQLPASASQLASSLTLLPLHQLPSSIALYLATSFFPLLSRHFSGHEGQVLLAWTSNQCLSATIRLHVREKRERERGTACSPLSLFDAVLSQLPVTARHAEAVERVSPSCTMRASEREMCFWLRERLTRCCVSCR